MEGVYDMNADRLDMQDLRAFAQQGRREREAELASARRVIGDELDRFLVDFPEEGCALAGFLLDFAAGFDRCHAR